MRRLPTAMAILLVVAGIAGVVAGNPASTDTRSTPTPAAATVPADTQLGEPNFERLLALRLSQFELTDPEIRQIVAEASRLRDDGASRLVIRSSIVMNLYGYGVEAPFLYDGEDSTVDRHDRFHRYIAGLDVTSEQARELHSMVHRLADDGASHEEIREAIRRQLAAWQEDDPDGVDRLVDRYELTDVQAAELERTIRRVVVDGADCGELRAVISRLLDSFGIDDRISSDRRSWR